LLPTISDQGFENQAIDAARRIKLPEAIVNF
jgi:hypothetical protein